MKTKINSPYWIPLLVSVGLGVLCFWRLFEIDSFHQIQAGLDILDGFKYFNVDHWTYTAKGEPWYPSGWLSYALFGLAFKIFGYGALSFLRSLLVFLWTLGIAFLIYNPDDESSVGMIKNIVLVPLIFISCLWRIHIRPDMIAAVLFVILNVIWVYRISDSKKCLWSLILLFVWSNIHSGVYPFGVLFFVGALWLFSSEPIKMKYIYSVISLCLWIANPLGILSLKNFFLNIAEYSGLKNQNEDQLSFSWGMLQLSHGAGYSYVVWLCYTLLGFFFIFALIKKKLIKKLPGPYGNPVFTLGLAIIFTIVTFLRVRGALYQTVFLSPILALGFSILLNNFRGRLVGVVLIFLMISIPVVFAANLALGGRRLGAGIAENFVPVHAVDYLKSIKIEGHILNHLDFGDIIIHRAPNIPVAIDGRDVLFRKLRKKWDEPNGFSDFLRDQNVTVILEKIAFNRFPYDVGPWSLTDWAPVFLDNSAVVYLKRIPAYAKIIERDGYRALFKDIQLQKMTRFTVFNTSSELEQEINRCLTNCPINVYCLYRKAKFFGQTNRPAAELADLNVAYSWEPWNPYVSRDRAELLGIKK